MMTKNKIHELFNIWQGDQITDEEIYNLKRGEYPILSGHNKIKGYTTKPRITDVPCITIPSKGIVNKLYIQTTPFDANNTIVLIPKNRKQIDLEYFVFTKSDYVTSFISSKNTNNYLNKETLANIEITYSSFYSQLQIKKEYQRLISLRGRIESILSRLLIQSNIDLNVGGDYKNINDIFVLTTGSDDNLTESYIYNNPGLTPVYSGNTKNEGILGHVNRIDYFPECDFITWAISGKAGSMYIRNGSCCLTRHCGMMVPKIKEEINLKWFIFTHQNRIWDFALAKEGLGEIKKNAYEIISVCFA